MNGTVAFLLIIGFIAALFITDIYYTRKQYKSNLALLKLEVENQKAKMKLEDERFKRIISTLDVLCEKHRVKEVGDGMGSSKP